MAPTRTVVTSIGKYGLPIAKRVAGEFADAGPLRDSYRFMKGLSRYIPWESASGQTSMFPAGFGRAAAPRAVNPSKVHSLVLAGIKADATAAKKAGTVATRPSPRDRVKTLAKAQEDKQKTRVANRDRVKALARAQELKFKEGR